MPNARVQAAYAALKNNLENFQGTEDPLDHAIDATLTNADIVRTFDRDDVLKAADEHEKVLASITTGGPTSVLAKKHEPWYFGADEKSENWNRLKKLLIEDGFDEDAINSIDKDSTYILGLNPPPKFPIKPYESRGLAIGYVQSGKTTNFTSVIAKASNAGYKFFIVLAGATNSLREQTQTRLDEQLDLGGANWKRLTNSDLEASNGTGDFSGTTNTVTSELSSANQSVIMIIKKNGPRLKRLIKWLKNGNNEEGTSSIFKTYRTILIDDEADQASLNAGSPHRRTAINNHINEILEITDAAYIGYTATPFANVLASTNDSKSLYPKDFIASLSKPKGYFGPEELFGRDLAFQVVNEGEGEDSVEAEYPDGHDMIRRIDEDDHSTTSERTSEASLLRHPTKKDDRMSWEPPNKEDLPELVKAVRYFLLATAAREHRMGKRNNSSMLVHTSMFIDPQNKMIEYIDSNSKKKDGPVLAILKEFQENVNDSDKKFLQELRGLWETETAKIDSNAWKLEAVGFDELLPVLKSLAVKEAVKIVVDNGESENRLNYSDEASVVIAIGGNTLSRGLTLEGLIVSYFIRTTGTYDTLLQMGRWFGFRNGYEDLPRIWMTESLNTNFRNLATVEEELRLDIKRYAALNKTPSEIATRIRLHPGSGLMPTARGKMKAAITRHSSYNGRSYFTIIFDNEIDIIERNKNAVKNLVQECVNRGLKTDELCMKPSRDSSPLIKDVPSKLITDFLTDYKVNANHTELDSQGLKDYISKNPGGQCGNWNVAFISNKNSTNENVNYGHGIEVKPMNRSRFYKERTNNEIDIRALPSETDASKGHLNDRNFTVDLGRLREKNDPCLLVIYTIDKDSKAKKDAKYRKDLDAKGDLVGIAVQIAYSDSDTKGVPIIETRLTASSIDTEETYTEEELIAEAEEELIAEEDTILEKSDSKDEKELEH